MGIASSPFDVLLVDDNPADITLATRALKVSGAPISVIAAKSGKEALQVLQQRAQADPTARSMLVLLDLNMPDWDGAATLGHIRSDPDVALTPVLVLTTSSTDRDIKRCYAAGANGYVVKPVDFSDLTRFFQSLHSFWKSHVSHPPARVT